MDPTPVIVLVLIFLFFLTLYLLNYYGDRKNCPWYAGCAAFVGWFFPFTVVLWLPLYFASVKNKKKRYLDLYSLIFLLPFYFYFIYFFFGC